MQLNTAARQVLPGTEQGGSSRLWRSCEREAARIQRRSARVFARGERDQHARYEADVRREASNVVAEAERVLRQQQRP
jgi:hypothetical protein